MDSWHHEAKTIMRVTKIQSYHFFYLAIISTLKSTLYITNIKKTPSKTLGHSFLQNWFQNTKKMESNNKKNECYCDGFGGAGFVSLLYLQIHSRKHEMLSVKEASWRWPHYNWWRAAQCLDSDHQFPIIGRHLPRELFHKFSSSPQPEESCSWTVLQIASCEEPAPPLVTAQGVCMTKE